MTGECHDRKQCMEMFEKLSEYLDGELDALTCADIETHAAHCISCKVCLETLKRTVDLCHHLNDRPVPAAFSQRLKKTLAQLQR